MLSRKVRSMNIFNGLKNKEIVEAILTEISTRQRELGIMKMNGYQDVEALTAVQSHLSKTKEKVRKQQQFTFMVESVLVAK